MTTPELHAALTNGAEGVYHQVAAVLLLTGHDQWPDRLDRAGLVLWDDDRQYAAVKWRDVLDRLDGPPRRAADDGPWDETYDELICSGSAARILRLACALGAGMPIDLRDALSSLDDINKLLVLDAVAHAMGGHQWADTLHIHPHDIEAEL
ncbi:hypothetical protein [Streptomyces sp. NBC_01304]|uniref:hypothetical protein n=1 Tax=Streptomyces sp. NBC_01304 TaxID=2903818 RepID=UPI002E0F59B1|nr:hypothetical protein OG430_44485 [Streptomyces sp. NBC_01304]